MAGDSAGEFPTIIGPDAKFKGELTFEKGVRHLGQFEGTIDSKGHLVIAEGAKLSGDVKAGSVDVQGEVKGNLNATGKVKLAQTARLEGDLHTARLEVQEGAIFVGRCVVGANGSAASASSAQAAAPAQRASADGDSAGGASRQGSKDREPIASGGKR